MILNFEKRNMVKSMITHKTVPVYDCHLQSVIDSFGYVAG